MDKNKIDISVFMSHIDVEENFSYKRGDNYKLETKIWPDANRSVGAVWRLIVRRSVIESEEIRFAKGMKYGEHTHCPHAAKTETAGLMPRCTLSLLNYIQSFCASSVSEVARPASP